MSYNAYDDINVIKSYIVFSIYKAYFMSDRLQKQLNILKLIYNELIFLDNYHKQKKNNHTLIKTFINNLQTLILQTTKWTYIQCTYTYLLYTISFINFAFVSYRPNIRCLSSILNAHLSQSLLSNKGPSHAHTSTTILHILLIYTFSQHRTALMVWLLLTLNDSCTKVHTTHTLESQIYKICT